MIRSMQLNGVQLLPDNPWGGVLSATAFAVRSTVHSTTGATPGRLVFGRDMMLNIKHRANWKLIKYQKQKRINENNKRENKGRIQAGDLVLVKDDILGTLQSTQSFYKRYPQITNGQCTRHSQY